MATTPKPQSVSANQRGQRAAYQYKSMNRYVPRQVRAWASASGNPYTLKNWTETSKIPSTNKDYFNNKLMQRLGGDWSLADRMRGMYYKPQELPSAWKTAPVWMSQGQGLTDWMKQRLQGDYGAMGLAQQQQYRGSGQEGGGSTGSNVQMGQL